MGCVTYPEIPYKPYIPSHSVQRDDFAWNTGANSVTELDGDVRCAFDMPAVVGAVIGFTTDRAIVGGYERLTHAWAFAQNADGDRTARVMEAGVNKTAETVYSAADSFELRRINGVVSYWINGASVHASRVASSGTLSVGCALYATGDAIPSEDVSASPSVCFWTDLDHARQEGCGGSSGDDDMYYKLVTNGVQPHWNSETKQLEVQFGGSCGYTARALPSAIDAMDAVDLPGLDLLVLEDGALYLSDENFFNSFSYGYETGVFNNESVYVRRFGPGSLPAPVTANLAPRNADSFYARSDAGIDIPIDPAEGGSLYFYLRLKFSHPLLDAPLYLIYDSYVYINGE